MAGKPMGQSHGCGLRRMRAVKAVGKVAALRIAETESTRDGVAPEGPPVRQIGGRFNDHQLPGRSRKREAERAAFSRLMELALSR